MANTNYGNNGFKVQGAAATQGPFNLLGGKYGVSVSATAFGTPGVALQILGPDGATYVNCLAPFTVNGASPVDLPPGCISSPFPLAALASPRPSSRSVTGADPMTPEQWTEKTAARNRESVETFGAGVRQMWDSAKQQLPSVTRRRGERIHMAETTHGPSRGLVQLERAKQRARVPPSTKHLLSKGR
jgi:hypothetical protein